MKKSLGQLLTGLLVALLSLAVIIGAFSLSLAEAGKRFSRPAPSSTALSILVETLPAETLAVTMPVSSLPSTNTLTPVNVQTTATPANTATSACPVPTGWSYVLIQIGDTLQTLAQEYGVTTAELAQSNCLPSEQIISLIPGAYLSVPPSPTPSITTSPAKTKKPHTATAKAPKCGPPAGWRLYTVKRGDTLSRISQAFGVSISQLQSANCLGTSTLIQVGQNLYVPNVPTQKPPTQKPPTQKPKATEKPPITQPPVIITPPETPSAGNFNPQLPPLFTTSLACVPTLGWKSILLKEICHA